MTEQERKAAERDKQNKANPPARSVSSLTPAERTRYDAMNTTDKAAFLAGRNPPHPQS